MLLLITIIIGVTYAVYTLTTTGNENSITTGLVSMSYTESTNVIDIKNALPMSDAEGKTQSNYFDFSVTSNLTLGENDSNTPVYYSIELEPLSTDTGYNALQDNQIKIYLEDKTNNKVLINSKLISALSNYALYNTNHTHKYNINSITTNYRLRTWIDYDVDASNWSDTNKYEYKFRINVNSNVDHLKGSTPEYCFDLSEQDDTTMTAYISDYKCADPAGMPPPMYNVPNIVDNNSLEMLPNISKTNDTLYSLENIDYPIINNVVIPSTINDYKIIGIASSAFNENNLTSVTIPNSVTTIGSYAFFSNKLTSVTIPNSVTTIGDSAFSGNNLTSVTIGDSVTTIGDSAFRGNNLTSVTIPNSVTTIGDSAFYSNNLTSVAIPNSVTTIGAYAFQNNNLTSVTIPNSVTTIGDSAFNENNLTSVTIPNSVTTIGNYVFRDNPNLTSIVVDINNTTYDSRNNSNAIIETSANELIQGCKTTIIPNTVTTIGRFAFSEMGLTEITIPNSVTTIGNYAFNENNLTSVTIPNSVTTIGNSAFSSNKLTSVTIGDSVTTIGDSAFRGNNLTSVTIPNSVTTIWSDAFSNNNLQYVLINEGSNLTSIGQYIFSTYNYSHTLTIYNNSGKSFSWGHATQRRSGYTFVTGSIPSYNSYGPVTVTTGTPS